MNVIEKAVVDAAVQVHREFGPELIETVYEDGSERIVHGLPDANLSVLASWRATGTQPDPYDTANPGPPGG